MKYIIIREKFITRGFVRSHPDWIFLFGDNIARQGSGGQAKEMRGEPNVIGIPTKYAPHMFPNAFMTDDRLEFNIERINEAFRSIPAPPRTICIPSDGIGTGLAKLEESAPQTFAHLRSCLEYLEHEI